MITETDTEKHTETPELDFGMGSRDTENEYRNCPSRFSVQVQKYRKPIPKNAETAQSSHSESRGMGLSPLKGGGPPHRRLSARERLTLGDWITKLRALESVFVEAGELAALLEAPCIGAPYDANAIRSLGLEVAALMKGEPVLSGSSLADCVGQTLRRRE